MRVLLLLGLVHSLSALPLNLISGEAVLANPNPNQLHITLPDQAMLEWETFSIETNEEVHFFQPSKESLAINRTFSETPSKIFGKLQANGKVLLINPHGVLIGEEAQIHTGSFIASTLDLNTDLFRNKRQIAFAGEGGPLIHKGKIFAQDSVCLISAELFHEGQIVAGVEANLFGNSGLINIQGSIEAPKILAVAEMIDAETGHFIGENIQIGKAGFTNISYVGVGVLLDASAKMDGDGGEIMIWGDRRAQFYGRALAQGGINGGNGGLIEVSSPGWVDFRGKVDTFAPNGITGQFILDPCDITINAAAGASIPAFTPAYIPGVNTTTVSVTDIGAALAGSNVSINTSPGAGGVGNIIWLNSLPLVYASGFSLTFNADNDVELRSDIVNSGAGALNINAGGSVVIGETGNPGTATIDFAGPIDIQCVSGFTIIGDDAGTLQGGSTTTVHVSNGDLLVTSPTVPAASAILGNPLLVTVPQGGITITATNGGTTGVGIPPGGGDYFSLIARDDILLFNGVNSRNENTAMFSLTGNPSLIESTTGSVIFHNEGQRFRYQPNFPLIIRAAGDFIFESDAAAAISTVQTGLFPTSIFVGGNITMTGFGGTGPAFICDAFTATAGGNFTLVDHGAFIFSGVQSSNDIFINVGGNFAMTQNNPGSTMTLFSFFGNIDIAAAGFVDIENNNTGFCITASLAGSTTLTSGLNMTYQGLGGGLAESQAANGITLISGGSIYLLNNSSITTDGTSMLFIADGDISLFGNALVDMVMPVMAGQTITFVVDNAFPNPPLIGSGGFFMGPGATIMTSQQVPIAIYSARQSQNIILGPINQTFFSAGTLFIDSDSERWCVYYPDGFNLVPFRIHYKECLQQVTEQADIIVTEMLFNFNNFVTMPGWFEDFSLQGESFMQPYHLSRRSYRAINQPKSYTRLIH